MAKTVTGHLITLFLLQASLCMSYGEAEVKGMFVFGSSLVDNGNNNFLRNSTARADYPPYGIDFPLGPSGRFSNGRNPIDVLGELLKLPSLIPPFADPRTRGPRIANGVNYASGGSGILDQTGSITGEVMSLSQQVRDFKTRTLPDFAAQLELSGHRGAYKHYLSKYLFVVGTGGNDYLLNYFIPGEKKRPALRQFTKALISTLSGQLKMLYDLGARKFLLFSIQTMGCVPVVRSNSRITNGSCVEAMNKAALLFNRHLKSLVHSTKTQMPGSKMVYINSYKIIRDIIIDPNQNGFSDTRKACCELSSRREGGNGILCRKGGRACGHRAAHVFFDGLHPTDAVNVRIAQKAYGSNLKAEAYPINVKQLARST
ncbi:GDSL esterase/lipase At1g29670-like [Phoenix dactylifera]|uniref:GDSL esterase/lipase At1g29670-like n=1 Tax=Phoenix dactylifera TaxID=42345 RepID=A0A8B7CGA1_PHODC|nr:GDSL esterase/lipase At1g29670-like [Phoenix dactylifera]